METPVKRGGGEGVWSLEGSERWERGLVRRERWSRGARAWRKLERGRVEQGESSGGRERLLSRRE